MARNSRQETPKSIMTQLNVKSELLIILKKLTVHQFTVDALTEAYLKDPVSIHTSKKAARQFVYRNMVRLMKTGDLERLVTKGSWPLYALTKQFTDRNSPAKQTTPHIDVVDVAKVKVDPAQSLKERLNRFKMEMLSAMGETEEYNAICSEIPELRDEVQARYNESRDRCSKLLGRVKALESLLAVELR